MGNTKTYYIEGELLPGISIENFKENAADGFHYTYCVAEIAESSGGYLNVTEGAGAFLVAAIHSFSLSGDEGPANLCKIFKEFRCHRLDIDWGDIWIVSYVRNRSEGPDIQAWKSDDKDWRKTA